MTYGPVVVDELVLDVVLDVDDVELDVDAVELVLDVVLDVLDVVVDVVSNTSSPTTSAPRTNGT
jgi:hypothetical protein